MSNSDKILEHIKADCTKNINNINAENEKVCAEILAKAEKDAQSAAAEITAKAKVKAEQMKSASKSSAELAQRNALLKKRRQEIDITFYAVLDYLLGLDDKNYFDIIYKLAKKLDGKTGVILLNNKDLKRLPSDFTKQLAKNGINAEVSKTSVDIDGGFILKCGDIEENMSFSSLMSDKRDEIEDLINRTLFTD